MEKPSKQKNRSHSNVAKKSEGGIDLICNLCATAETTPVTASF